MTLKDLQIGESGKITAIRGEGALRLRLLDMGMLPDTIITLRNLAPLGDPMEFMLRDYVLTLRADDAAAVEVER